MAGALRNTMVWLGFAEDERDREDYYDDEYDTHAEADDRGHGAYRHEDDDHGHTAEVTQLRRTPVSAVVRDVEVGGLLRLHDGLVVDRHVVHDVGVGMRAAIHALEARAHDVPDLVAVGGVVRDDGRVRAREDRRVAVRVLQALTGQRRAPGGGADHEAARHLVTGRPEGVTRALEAGDHRQRRDHEGIVRFRRCQQPGIDHFVDEHMRQATRASVDRVARILHRRDMHDRELPAFSCGGDAGLDLCLR